MPHSAMDHGPNPAAHHFTEINLVSMCFSYRNWVSSSLHCETPLAVHRAIRREAILYLVLARLGVRCWRCSLAFCVDRAEGSCPVFKALVGSLMQGFVAGDNTKAPCELCYELFFLVLLASSESFCVGPTKFLICVIARPNRRTSFKLN